MPYGTESDYYNLGGYQPSGELFGPQAEGATGWNTPMTPEQRRMIYGGLTGEAPATISPTAPPTAPTSEPGLLSRLFTGFQKTAPLWAKVGGQFMGGMNTDIGKAGLMIGQGLESMQLNTAMRKMLSDYLSGRQPGAAGPTGSPSQVGIDDLTAMGLTPEGVKHVYGAGMTATEKARKEPFEILGMAADVHQRVASGDLHEAQIPYVKAQTEQLITNILNTPFKNFLEMQKAWVEVAKLQADIIHLDEQMRKSKAEREKMGVETEAAGAKMKREEWQATPEGMRMKAHFDAMEKQIGTPLAWHQAGDKWVATHPFTGAQVGSFPIGAAPGAEALAGKPAVQRLAAEYAARDMMPQIEAGIMARFKDDKQAQARQMQMLREMFKNPETAGMASVYLSNFLTPAQQAEYDNRVRAHAATLPAGGPAPKAIPSAAPAPATPAPGFTVNPAAKLPPKQEPGKPVLDFPTILADAMKTFNKPMKASEFKQWVYDTYAKPKNIPKAVSDTIVDKGLAASGQLK